MLTHDKRVKSSVSPEGRTATTCLMYDSKYIAHKTFSDSMHHQYKTSWPANQGKNLVSFHCKAWGACNEKLSSSWPPLVVHDPGLRCHWCIPGCTTTNTWSHPVSFLGTSKHQQQDWLCRIHTILHPIMSEPCDPSKLFLDCGVHPVLMLEPPHNLLSHAQTPCWQGCELSQPLWHLGRHSGCQGHSAPATATRKQFQCYPAMIWHAEMW